MFAVGPELLDDPLYKAARIRAQGGSWLSVGATLNLSPDDAERLTLANNPFWVWLLRRAEKEAYRELSCETVTRVKIMLRDKDPKVVTQGAHLGMSLLNGLMRHRDKKKCSSNNFYEMYDMEELTDAQHDISKAFPGRSPINNPTLNATTTTRTTEARMPETIRKARADPVAFLKFLLMGAEDRNPMAPVHVNLQTHLTNHRMALVELPRDHGKTTQVCLRVLWELGRNPNLRVKIVCASEAIAVDRSRFLRSSIEQNPRIRRVFPHLRKANPWLATSFSIQRSPGILGPSVAAFGIGAASTGTRADLLVCDDVAKGVVSGQWVVVSNRRIGAVPN